MLTVTMGMAVNRVSLRLPQPLNDCSRHLTNGVVLPQHIVLAGRTHNVTPVAPYVNTVPVDSGRRLDRGAVLEVVVQPSARRITYCRPVCASVLGDCGGSSPMPASRLFPFCAASQCQCPPLLADLLYPSAWLRRSSGTLP
jgi:hypothetical protein